VAKKIKRNGIFKNITCISDIASLWYRSLAFEHKITTQPSNRVRIFGPCQILPVNMLKVLATEYSNFI